MSAAPVHAGIRLIQCPLLALWLKLLWSTFCLSTFN